MESHRDDQRAGEGFVEGDGRGKTGKLKARGALIKGRQAGEDTMPD